MFKTLGIFYHALVLARRLRGRVVSDAGLKTKRCYTNASLKHCLINEVSNGDIPGIT